ncbi:MAG: aminotransferase class V-fold PLP-dependent enzyme, partial [bacterium]
MFAPKLLRQIRDRFHHVDRCPYQGARIFFENAGGSLTLKSVVETNARLSAIPDNQGRDNPASAEMMRLIKAGKADMMTFLGATSGLVFAGETGTECLFRVLRAAIMNASESSSDDGVGGQVLGGALEHPATSSAARLWSARAGMEYIAVAHDARTCALTADDYARHATARTQVATIIHTSPVSGTSVDVGAVAAAIRAASPRCFIIVDGIQHAPHGGIAVADYDIDAYAISGYKVFSRHNYGFAWVSERLSAIPHDHLIGTADNVWELGTRDASAYATFSEVVAYLDWLGAHFTDADDGIDPARRARITAAAVAIAAHERDLIEAMLRGLNGQKGLAQMP